MKNAYTNRIIEVIEKQTDKGIRKYGAELKENPLHLTPLQVLEYASEEGADLMVYLEKAKEMLKEMLDGGKFTDKFPVRGLMLGLLEGSVTMNEIELRINGYMMIERIKAKGEAKLDILNKAFKDSQRPVRQPVSVCNGIEVQSHHLVRKEVPDGY